MTYVSFINGELFKHELMSRIDSSIDDWYLNLIFESEGMKKI